MPRISIWYGILIFFIVAAAITVGMILNDADRMLIPAVLFGYSICGGLVLGVCFVCLKIANDNGDHTTQPGNGASPQQVTPGEPLLPRPAFQFPAAPNVRIRDDDDRFDDRPGSWPATPSRGTQPRRRQQPPQELRNTQPVPPVNFSPEHTRGHPGTPDALVYQRERSGQNEPNTQPAQLEAAVLDEPSPQTIRQRTEQNEPSPQTARQNRSLQNSPTRRSVRLNRVTQQRPNSHPSQQANHHPHNSVQPHEEELVHAGWEQQAKERTNEAVVNVFDDGREKH